MDELIKMVAERTGLSEDMAQQAVETVLDYVKDKLPAPIAGQIDGVLKHTDKTPDLGGIAQGLGGLFGK